MEKYKMAKELHDRDPKLDPVKFNKIMSETYYKNGRYPDIEAQIKSKNLGVYFNNNKAKGSEEFLPPEYRTLTGGKQEVRDRKYGSTIAQTKEFITQSILSDRGLMEGASDEFNSLPESKKWEYLKDFDTDKSGTLDATEQSTIPSKESQEPTNPILRYAQDKYLELAREDRSSAWKGATVGSTATGDMKTFKYVTGNPTKYNPVEAIETTLGATSYKKYHSFGQFETYFIPAENIEVQNANGNTEKITVKNLKVIPTGYDENKREFTFNVLQNYKSGNTRGNGDQIAIKLDKLPKEFGNIEVLIGGKPVKIKDIPNTPNETPEEDPWSKYKRK
jgi:hypothetical protein